MSKKNFIPAKYKAQGVTEKQWTDWRWQLANSIKTAEQLGFYANLNTKKIQQIKKIIENKYQNGQDSMRITPYLLSIMDLKNPKDPIALQHFPNIKESIPDNFNFNKVWERSEDFLDGSNRLLQQKYPDIMLLRIANTCQSFCRFCFEKERTLRGKIKTTIGQEQFEKSLKIIRSKKSVRQILLSGGDPSILPDQKIKELLEGLIKIPHLKTIRINTRTLTHNPFRITPEFAKMLGDLQKSSWKKKKTGNPSSEFNTLIKGKQIKVGVHFNHSKELTKEAITAIRRLQSQGIELYNQTVLLKGINDDHKTIYDLFKKLREEGVELHYFSYAMMVPRTSHFRTTVKKGQEILGKLLNTNEFRGQLPHYEMSHFKGKQIIPITMNKHFFEDKVGKKPIIRYLSDISCKWETFPNGD